MARIHESGARAQSTDTAVMRPPSIDRRRFLEIGPLGALGAAASLNAGLAEISDAADRAAASDRGLAPAGSAGGSRGAQAPGPAGLRPHAVIYDERFESARRFAVCVRRIPVPVHSMCGDVTQLWYSHLYPLWKRTPAPIVGLTAYAAMFCLERLAWDRELRMVRCVAGNTAPGSSGWPMERAAMVARGFRASWLATSGGACATGEAVAAAKGPLYFWLIASPPQLAALRT